MADREKEVIRELVNLPTTVYCGFYQLRITHSLRDETVKLLKEQQKEIEDLKSKIQQYRYYGCVMPE